MQTSLSAVKCLKLVHYLRFTFGPVLPSCPYDIIHMMNGLMHPYLFITAPLFQSGGKSGSVVVVCVPLAWVKVMSSFVQF